MKALESFSVLKSVGNGIFSEVSTVEMTDIVGGSCGGGGGGCPPTNWSPSLPGDPGQFGTTHGFW